MSNKDTFCLMPWIHLYVAQNGKVNACCNAPIQYGNAQKNNLKLLFKGNDVNTLKNKLLKGEKDNRCKICYEQEKAGKSSIRTETLEKYKHYWKYDTETQNYSIQSPPDFPVYFDIRFSNVCNLKCRTCWHGNSSSWFEDAKEIGNAIGNKAILKATDRNTALIDEILENTNAIEEIYFAGGEPLMMEEHYYFLDRLIKKGAQPLLRYNTNLSRLYLKDKNVLDYWKHFDNVEVMVSIDQLNEKFEYVRKNAKWEQTIDNIQTLKSLKNIKIDIAPTISVFNIPDLPELHRFFAINLDLGWNAIYFNLLQRPDFYSIQSLAPELKIRATKNINQHIKDLENKTEQRITNELKGIITFMNAKQLDKSIQFEQYNNKLDELRNESFKNTFSDLIV